MKLLACLLAAAFVPGAHPVHAQSATQTVTRTAPHTPYTYQSVTFGAGGFITGFVAHPAEQGLYYVRTDIGGAYRWDAKADRWSPLLDWLPFAERNLLGVESLAIDPTDPKKLYLAAGTYVNPRVPNGAVLRSVDQGRHFEVTHVPLKLGGNEDGRFAGERLQVDPNQPQTLVLGTREDGLWRSADSGVHWNRVRTFPAIPFNKDGVTFVAFDPRSGTKGQPTPVLFAGLCDPIENLLRSDDAGKHWKPVVGGPTGMFPNHGALAADGTLYLSYTDAPGPNGVGNGAVWAYQPRTGAWRDVTPEKPGTGGPQQAAAGARPGRGFGYGAVAVDPEHAGTLYASTIDRWQPGDTIFRSTDSGAHWVSLKEGATRDDSLAPYLQHTAAEAPFGHWLGSLMVDPFQPAHVLYGTGETIWESEDATAIKTHWTAGVKGLEETAVITLLSPPAAAGAAAPHLYSGLGDIGCFRNDDFGRSPAGGAMKNPELSNCDALALAADKPQEMVRVGRSWTRGAAHGAISHDGGLHWTPFASEPAGGERGGSAAIAADGRSLLWAVPGGPLALSFDGGTHWRVLAAAPEQKRRGGLEVVARAAGGFWVYDPPSGSLRVAGADGTLRAVAPGAPAHARLRVASAGKAAGETLWLASDGGLWQAAVSGEGTVAAFRQVRTVAAAYAVGFGKPAEGAARPAIYLAGALVGTVEAEAPRGDQSRGGGLYRSLDDGESWQRIDDPEHRFAWVEQITGDPRIAGRVYFGTNGRGVFWGDPTR